MSYNPYQQYNNNPDQYASTPTTPAAFSPWDLEQDPSTSLQQPQDQPPQAPAFVPTIHVPERVASSSQGQWRLRDYVHQPAVQPSEEAQSGGQAPPPLAAPPGAMPVRSTGARERSRAAAHPYRRPESHGQGSGIRTSSSRTDVQSSDSSHALRLGIPPVIGSSAVAMGCPASGQRATSAVPSAEGTSPATHPAPSSSVPARNYAIRADVHYDATTNRLIAMLELPGVKKNNIKIVLSKCPYTRVRQITVSGISSSVFPDVGYSVRERKFGRFARTLVVPPETTADKVVAEMADGILTLTVPGPEAPEAREEPAAIPIP